MKAKWMWVLMMITGLSAGCPFAPPMTGGGGGLSDTDGDGFLNLPLPMDADVTDMVSVEIVNELTRDQLLGLVPTTGFEGFLAFVQIQVSFDLTLMYANGETVPFSDMRELGPFELRFEAACPESVRAVGSVDVSALGSTVFSQELPAIVLTQDDFDCGRLISIRAFLNDATGQPDIDWVLADL